MAPRLELLTGANRDAAIALRVRPDQWPYVATVEQSLEDASEHDPAAVWQRLIYDDDTLVGFVMAGWFDGHELFDSGLWRLLVAAEQQGKGYGRFAVGEVVREARRRGRDKVTVFFHPGPDGPEAFYEKLGFRLNGKAGDDAEVQAQLVFDASALEQAVSPGSPSRVGWWDTAAEATVGHRCRTLTATRADTAWA